MLKLGAYRVKSCFNVHSNICSCTGVDLSITSNGCVVEQKPNTLILLYDISAIIVKQYNSPS